MRWLLMLENPWCLASLLLLIVLLLMAGALTAWSRRVQERDVVQQVRPRLQKMATTAPLEALYGLSERLAHVQRQLPAPSEDAVWLGQFRMELQQVIEYVYQKMLHTDGVEREELLSRLDDEVAELDRIVGARLATRLDQTTDRRALHTQLEQLRAALRLSHKQTER
jgi:hypothetical protein